MRELQPGGLLKILSHFQSGKAQIIGVYFNHPALGAQEGQIQLRLGAAGDYQVQVGCSISDQEAKPLESHRIFQILEIVENQCHIFLKA